MTFPNSDTANRALRYLICIHLELMEAIYFKIKGNHERSLQITQPITEEINRLKENSHKLDSIKFFFQHNPMDWINELEKIIKKLNTEELNPEDQEKDLTYLIKTHTDMSSTYLKRNPSDMATNRGILYPGSRPMYHPIP